MDLESFFFFKFETINLIIGFNNSLKFIYSIFKNMFQY